MTASVLQERETSSTVGGTSISLAFSSNNTAGSAIHAIGTWGDKLNSLSSITDTNNTYGAVLDSIHDTTNSQSVGHSIAVNIAAGANTVQANYGVSVSFRGILIREIGGVAAAPNDGHNGQFQSAPGTGTDAISSLTATNTVQPVLMSGLSMDNGGGTPSAGTGFTLGINAWAFAPGNIATSEHERFTTTTGKAATFTGSGTPITLTVMAMFDEAAAAAVDPLAIEDASLQPVEPEESSDVQGFLHEPIGPDATAQVDQFISYLPDEAEEPEELWTLVETGFLPVMDVTVDLIVVEDGSSQPVEPEESASLQDTVSDPLSANAPAATDQIYPELAQGQLDEDEFAEGFADAQIDLGAVDQIFAEDGSLQPADLEEPAEGFFDAPLTVSSVVVAASVHSKRKGVSRTHVIGA